MLEEAHRQRQEEAERRQLELMGEDENSSNKID